MTAWERPQGAAGDPQRGICKNGRGFELGPASGIAYQSGQRNPTARPAWQRLKALRVIAAGAELALLDRARRETAAVNARSAHQSRGTRRQWHRRYGAATWGGR